jgi:hypothetical protein
MLLNTFSWLIVIPFILGFVTYGIRQLLKPRLTTYDPVTLNLPAETLQQLKEKGYLDPNTGKLKEAAVGQVKLEALPTKT